MTEFERNCSLVPFSIPKQKSIYIPALYSLQQLNKMSENMSVGNTLEIPVDQFKEEYNEECIENNLVLKDGQFKKEYIEDYNENKIVLEHEKKPLSCTNVKGLLLPYDQFKTEYADELPLSGNSPKLKKIKMSEYECYDIDEDLDIKSFHLEDKKKEVRKMSNKVPTTTKINILVPVKKDQNIAIQNNTKSPESHNDKLLTNPKVLGNDTKIKGEVTMGHLQKELLKEVEQVEQKMKFLIQKDNQITELNKRVKILTDENNRFAELKKIKSENEKKTKYIKREMQELETIMKEKEELVLENKTLLSEKSLKENEIYDLKKRNDYLLEADANNANTINSLRSEQDNILKEKEEKIKKLQNQVDELEKTTDEKAKQYENLQSVLRNEENEASELEMQLMELLQIIELNQNYSLKDAKHFISIINKNKLNLLKENEANSKLQSKVAELEKITDEKTKKYEDLQSALHIEENKVGELELQIIELAKKITKLSDLNKNYELEVDALKAELIEEQIKVRKVNEINDNRQKIFTEKCEEQTTQIQEYQNLLRSEKDKILELQSQAIELTNERDKLLQLNVTCNGKINAMNSELLIILNEKEELVKENKRLASDVAIKENEICNTKKRLVSEVDILKNELAEEKMQLEILRNEKNVFIEENKSSHIDDCENEIYKAREDESFQIFEVANETNDQPTTSKSSKTSPDKIHTESDIRNNIGGELSLTSATLKEANASSSESKANAFPSEIMLPAKSVDIKTSHSLPINDTTAVTAEKNPVSKRRRIYVGRLPTNGMLTPNDIRHHFSQFGKVAGVNWPFNHFKNTPKNFCFVGFGNEKTTEALIEKGWCQIKGRFGFLYSVEIRSSHE